MKVCPVQRYGLPEVMKHYIETGDVLGKNSDNLEGYSLPDKGYFKPGRLPKFEPGFFDMATRTLRRPAPRRVPRTHPAARRRRR